MRRGVLSTFGAELRRSGSLEDMRYHLLHVVVDVVEGGRKGRGGRQQSARWRTRPADGRRRQLERLVHVLQPRRTLQLAQFLLQLNVVSLYTYNQIFTTRTLLTYSI